MYKSQVALEIGSEQPGFLFMFQIVILSRFWRRIPKTPSRHSLNLCARDSLYFGTRDASLHSA